MTNLIRWDPFREMMTLRSVMDRLFENAYINPSTDWLSSSTLGMALDVAETDDEYLVKASLPGINLDEVEITLTNNVLNIQAQTKEEKDVEERRYHLRERRYGSFSRSVALPSSVNADKIEAVYEAGVLTLHLPKVEEAKPRRITVHASGTSKMIEGKATDIKSKN